MTDFQTNTQSAAEGQAASTYRVGFYAALLTAILTIVTFSLAITALPNSGSGCLVDCVEYPYLDTLAEYPGDYLWMPPAIFLILAYAILMIAIHAQAPHAKKIYSQIGLTFASMAALVLVVAYFLQFSIVPISLMKGEMEGLALLTQYNPHGVFIALEELGYLLMSLSFLFMAPALAGKSRLEAVIRWIFIAGFALAWAALVLITIRNGIDRQDSFEIAVISIDWLVLLVNGILLSLLFRKQSKSE